MNYTDIFYSRGASYNQANIMLPEVRKIERDLLLELLKISAHDVVIDAPAGGGYVSEALVNNVTQIFSIEPSVVFAQDMPKYLQRICSPIYQIPLPSGGANKYASLAGLHHLSGDEIQATFKEAYRLLAPSGILAVADVKANSHQALFLNNPVDQFTETGHTANFFEDGQLTEMMQQAGFKEASECYKKFHWIFDNREQMIYFVKNLFGMTRASFSQVEEAINTYLNPKISFDRVTLSWGLIYASCIR